MNVAALLFGTRYNPARVRAQWAGVLVEERAAGRLDVATWPALAQRAVQQERAFSARLDRSLHITLAWAAVASFGVPGALTLLQITPGSWAVVVIAGNAMFGFLIWSWRARALLPLPSRQTGAAGAARGWISILENNELRSHAQSALSRALVQALVLSAVWTSAAALLPLVTVAIAASPNSHPVTSHGGSVSTSGHRPRPNGSVSRSGQATSSSPSRSSGLSSVRMCRPANSEPGRSRPGPADLSQEGDGGSAGARAARGAAGL